MGRRVVKYLVDSVIIIDHLNNIKSATDFLANNFKDISISVITRAEVLAGVEKKSLTKVKQLLDQFQTLSMTAADADVAADIRSHFKIKLPDAIQAALAQNYQLTLVTRNTKDFNKRRFKNILVPYTV